ncbi:MAG: pyridoxamine 5'-phosphate oxidase family protein [Deltaproteobacteria bacterium]|jgi:predicted pyridoxine 5'-phosphate oxidase superfamily flavin-nucleotide-binding protein|nr:pyridoxamine 5'-phosphate oxidase family protein [Deltaproteobacteria bacterium]
MTVISQEIRDFVAGKLGWVATADLNGWANLAPKGTVQVLDEESLVFADLFSLKTRANLEKNPKVAVAVVDASSPAGYQFKGQAELHASGPIYEAVAKKLKEAMPDLPAPKYVVRIPVDEIYSLSPGPDAGAKIA